jgi:hypothetical protein
MKKLFAVVALTLLLVLVAGCEDSRIVNNKSEPCVGINESDRNPKLEYRASTQNVVLAVIFSETIIVPIVVVLNETFCPIGTKR